jgi:hypothetical protein
MYCRVLSEAFDFVDLRFLKVPLEKFRGSLVPGSVSCAFSQRTLHYLRPLDALNLFERLGEMMEAGAKCFLSASGISSELGDGYRGREIPWEQRYFPLSSENQKKHGIEGAVCLYSETELAAAMERSGFSCETIYSSQFGNVKGVFVRRG